MKKRLSILLLLLFATISVGLYPVLALLQLQSRKLSETMIERGQVRHFTVFANLSGKDIVWESDNEFSYNGQMYDIAKVEKKEGSTIFYCYSDKKETGIRDEICSLAGRATPANNSSQENLLHIMTLLAQAFMPADMVAINPRLYFSKKTLPRVFYMPGHSSRCIDIPAPPPWA